MDFRFRYLTFFITISGSVGSWEYQQGAGPQFLTPAPVHPARSRDFKTPRVDGVTDSPQVCNLTSFHCAGSWFLHWPEVWFRRAIFHVKTQCVQNLAFRHLTIILQFQAELPQVEIGGDGGSDSGLMRSVSHYRKQKPVVKIVRNVEFIENEPTGKYILEPIILETIWGPIWGPICNSGLRSIIFLKTIYLGLNRMKSYSSTIVSNLEISSHQKL